MLSQLFHFVLGLSSSQSFPPPLPPEKEAECFALASKGDEKAREKLIVHNLRLVSHIVRKYYSSSPNQEDLVSIGTIGLVKSIDSFDAKNGARFATYATKCIQNEILMHFRSCKKLASEVSINETIDVDRDGNPLTYIDVIGCDECISEEIERKIQIEKALKYVSAVLNERERQIIIMRYGLYGRRALTQKETADKLGISRSYVSRIEKSALDKLRDAFKKR
jgi:RNA polymerase sporulation-specific sigma factor